MAKVPESHGVLTALRERASEIIEQGEEVKKEIRVLAEEMMHLLQEDLTREVELVVEAKLQVLAKQKQSFERKVEESTKISQTLIPERKEVTIKVEEFSPLDIQLIKNTKDVLKILHYIGRVVSSTTLQQCKAKVTKIERLLKEKMVSFSLSLELPDSSLLTVPVSSLSCSLVPVGKRQPITTTVTTTTTHPGVYTIHCSPLISGRHQVNVQVHDVHLENTSLVIPFNPYLDTITPVRIIGELNHPRRVAVSNDGHVIVSECVTNGRVTVLYREGKKVKSFGRVGGSGNVKFTNPRGVAITPDNFILVTDDHRIQKITMDGQCIASVGEEGSGPLQFHAPSGIAISPITGRVYIADQCNHRIQVFSHDLTFCRSFGTKGSAVGQLHNPIDITIDSQGLLYVIDYVNNRIQKFTPEGEFVAWFGTKGSGPGQFSSPVGITVDTADLVCVTEWGDNNRVSIFTSEGQFVRSYGEKGVNEDQFNSPVGITFDKEGVLYVCDYGNNRLVVY